MKRSLGEFRLPNVLSKDWSGWILFGRVEGQTPWDAHDYLYIDTTPGYLLFH